MLHYPLYAIDAVGEVPAHGGDDWHANNSPPVADDLVKLPRIVDVVGVVGTVEVGIVPPDGHLCLSEEHE